MSYIGRGTSAGQVPIWDGGKWVPGTATSPPDNAVAQRIHKLTGPHYGVIPGGAIAEDRGPFLTPDPDITSGRRGLYDGRQGYVWVITAANQFSRYNPSGTVSALTQANGGTGTGALTVTLGTNLRAISLAQGQLWVGDFANSLVTRYNVKTESGMPASLGSFTPSGGSGTGVEAMYPADDGNMWICRSTNNTVVKVSIASPGTGTAVALSGAGPVDVIFALGFIWVVGGTNGNLYKINPTTNAIVDTIALNGGASTLRRLATDGRDVWISGPITSGSGVQRVGSSSLTEIGFTGDFSSFGGATQGIAFDGRYIWVTNDRAGGGVTDYVAVIDPDNNKIAQIYALTIGANVTPSEMFFASHYLWVTGTVSSTVFSTQRDFAIHTRDLLVGLPYAAGGAARVQAGQAFITITGSYTLAADEMNRRVITLLGTPGGGFTLTWPDVLRAATQYTGGSWIIQNATTQTCTAAATGGSNTVAIATGTRKLIFKSDVSGAVAKGMYEVP